MRSKRELIAHYSVTELHQWIEEVFTGRAGYPLALERLLASFSASFSMVTIKGQLIGLSEVENLFRNSQGSRPGLRIETDACETLGQTETTVTCRYREAHHEQGITHVRWSVVTIEFESGQPRWRYLQETAVAK
ncbi:hypothetical protein [Pantoea septica]|uniref:hypothetical protein n=1 Tax=Pantoea septica TaxID=472695 RepID=UPI0005352DF5|nr:hypothetical protein [Pantoea septica]